MTSRSALITGVLLWLSPSTKREPLAKLSRLRLKIGVPARWRDYRDLEIKGGDLFGNVMRGRAFDNGAADGDKLFRSPSSRVRIWRCGS